MTAMHSLETFPTRHADGTHCTGKCGSCETKGKRGEVRPFERILVAVDHENHPALETALLMAQAFHSQMAITHVLETGVTTSDLPEVYAQTLELRRGYAFEMLKAIDHALPENARAITCLREGAAPTEIVVAATEWNADLIIMGTHRRGAVAQLFLGSTSQAVLRHAQCPVLFVSDPMESSEAGGKPVA